MSENETDREEGINFTDINPVLEEIEYPITMEEFVAKHGSHTIERTNADPITVQEVFEGTGEDTFESAEEVQQSLLNLMPEESVGREGYSDRGGSPPDSTQNDNDQESL